MESFRILHTTLSSITEAQHPKQSVTHNAVTRHWGPAQRHSAHLLVVLVAEVLARVV